MVDMAAISQVLSSIKAASDIAKLLKETDISLEKAETKLKLAELVGALADAKLELAEVQNLLLSPQRLAAMSKAAYEQGRPYAAKDIAELVVSLPPKSMALVES